MLWKRGRVMLSYWDLIKSFKGPLSENKTRMHVCRCKKRALPARKRPEHRELMDLHKCRKHLHHTLRNVFDSLPASSSCCQGNARASQRSYNNCKNGLDLCILHNISVSSSREGRDLVLRVTLSHSWCVLDADKLVSGLVTGHLICKVGKT